MPFCLIVGAAFGSVLNMRFEKVSSISSQRNAAHKRFRTLVPKMTFPDEHKVLPKKRLLHVFPSFGVGGLPLRMCRVINHFGTTFAHLVIALDGDFAARQELRPELDVKFLSCTKRNVTRAVLEAVLALRRLRPDLLITYNWGSIEWAIAKRVLGIAQHMAIKHIHFEAGFGKEEADAQISRRVFCRRWTFNQSTRIVVPSYTLRDVALQIWKVSTASLVYIPNGVDVARFSSLPRDGLPGFVRKDGELVVGTVAPLRPEKNITRLLDAFARVNASFPLRLIVAGDGSERNTLQMSAGRLGISDRVIFTGTVKPEAVLGSLDVFALSSDTEQMPNAVLEAMAAGLAVVAVNVGDIRHLVSSKNQPFIVPRDDKQSFSRAIEQLMNSPGLRRMLGQENLLRAQSQFSIDRMLRSYSSLFHGILDPLELGT